VRRDEPVPGKNSGLFVKSVEKSDGMNLGTPALIAALRSFVWALIIRCVALISGRLRSVSIVGNFTQMPAKIFEPGTRISAVQHPADKAQLLGRVIPVAPNIVLGELA
jgi:hypothetical protein